MYVKPGQDHLAIQAVVVLGPTGLVATRCLRTGDWNLPPHVEALDDIPSMEHVMAAMQEASEKCAQASDEDPDTQALWQHQRIQAAEFRDNLYLQLAFPLPRTEREQGARVLSQRGFAGQFDSDWDLRQLVRYSLVFSGEGNELEAAADTIDELPNAILSRINDINEVAVQKLGVKLFEIQGKFVTAMV